MNTDPSVSLKRKQWIIALGVIGGSIALLVFGMWLSDPNRKHSASIDAQRLAKSDRLEDYTVRSSGVVSAEDAWIEMSEQRMKQLETTNAELNNRLQQMMNLIENGALDSTASRSTPGITLPTPTDTPERLDADIAKSQNTLDVADKLLSAATTPDADETTPALPPPIPISQPVTGPESGNENLTPVSYPINRASTFPTAQTPPVPQNTLPPPSPIINNRTSVDGQVPAAGQSGANPSSIMVVSLSDSQPDQKPLPNVDRWLSAGSFATAILMSGMDAPTGGAAETNPLPVLLRIKDDGQLPNFFRSNISDCHLIGAGYGDIASERAKIRLETLSCVLKNGDILEVPVSGFIAGEDGKNGMRGRVVPRTGSLIAKSLLAGTLGGIGGAVGEQYNQISTSPLGSVTTLDPNKIAQAGLAQGSQNALEKLADFYLARANEIYPVIEIEANRIGEIILTSKVDLGGTILNNTRRYSR